LTSAVVARYFALDGDVDDQDGHTGSGRKRAASGQKWREFRPLEPAFPTAGNTPVGGSNSVREWFTLPAASCLAFTPNAASLVLVTRSTDELCAVALDTGKKRWRCKLEQDGDASVSAHAMAVSNQPIGKLGYLIAIGCSDGRVRIHSSEDGRLLFVCPCVSSKSGHPPLPARLAFAPGPDCKLAVIYTNNQLTEWSLLPHSEASRPEEQRADESTMEDQTAGKTLRGTLNPWLARFWRVMGEEFSTAFGSIHSLAYLNAQTWLMASDRYVIQLKKGSYAPGGIKKRVSDGSKPELDSCFLFTSQFESILQVNALNEHELALVSVHSAAIAQRLTAPLQRKFFGL
uniref:ANAPC4_WD40 domain-containing protein n=1 Tax=Echinostoma caproni TaxID=27848 RepID=A0A183AM98_9TREM